MARRLAGREATYLVAEEDGSAIGLAGISPGWLEQLYVLPRLRAAAWARPSSRRQSHVVGTRATRNFGSGRSRRTSLADGFYEARG